MQSIVSEFLPFLSWIRKYPIGYLRADIGAGLTVAVVAIPQSMALALVTGLPVEMGLYASIVPTVIASLWGSSSQLITGPTTAISLVVFNSLSGIALPGTAKYIELVLLMSIMVGVMQAGMGFTRLGMLLNFVSHSVVLGFSAGAAVLIGVSQLPGILGLDISKGRSFLGALSEIGSHFYMINWITFLLGILTITIVVVLKKFRPSWPGTLLALLLSGFLVFALELESRGVAVVGGIPRSLPPFRIPGFDLIGDSGRMVPGALAICLLGLVEALSIAKAIASNTRQRLNVNQEFIGQGLANISAGFFCGFPGSGSFVRTAVNFRSGSKTPLSGVFSGLAVTAMILIAAPLAANLSIAALSGILIVVVFGMIHLKDMLRVIRATRNDAVALIVTFLSTLLINIEFAIYVGVLLSIGLHMATTSHPRIHSMVPDLNSGKLVESAGSQMCCQMEIIRIEGSIFFGSAAFVLEDLKRRLKSHPHITCLLIRMHQVNNFDASGVHLLEQVNQDLRSRGGSLYFAGVHTRVFQVFKNSGLLNEIGGSHIKVSTRSAIREAMRESFYPAICAACEFEVFQECGKLKNGEWETLGKGVQPRCAKVRGMDGGTKEKASLSKSQSSIREVG